MLSSLCEIFLNTSGEMARISPIIKKIHTFDESVELFS